MKKKYTWIAVISAILAIASAAAAVIIFLQMKKKNEEAVEEEVPSDFDDYDIDFLLDNEDEEIPDFDPEALFAEEAEA